MPTITPKCFCSCHSLFDTSGSSSSCPQGHLWSVLLVFGYRPETISLKGAKAYSCLRLLRGYLSASPIWHWQCINQCQEMHIFIKTVSTTYLKWLLMERQDKILLYLFFLLEQGHLCGGQRSTFGSRFSPIMWIPGIELRLTRLGNRCPHPCDISKAWVLTFTMEDSFSPKHDQINVAHSIRLVRTMLSIADNHDPS